METINIKTETADAIRAAAPKFNLVASNRHEIVAPGIEQLHLNAFQAMKFNQFRKAKKLGVDAAIRRLIK